MYPPDLVTRLADVRCRIEELVAAARRLEFVDGMKKNLEGNFIHELRLLQKEEIAIIQHMDNLRREWSKKNSVLDKFNKP